MSSYYAFINDLITCFICGEKFKRKDYFKEHLSNHLFQNETLNVNNNSPPLDTLDHSEGENNSDKNQNECMTDFTVNIDPVKYKEIHICYICGKEFKNRDHLKKHLPVHSNKKPFTCLVCGKSFSRKDRLKEHCIIHLANGWSCYFCGKMFSQRCILRKHEMIHRGVKPFSCDLCDRKFSRKNDLVRHYTTHTGEKDYFCEVCGKGFSQRRLVKRHLNIHRRKSRKI